VTMSNSDQETVLVIGATGRHGGTGARVVERLQAAGRVGSTVQRGQLKPRTLTLRTSHFPDPPAATIQPAYTPALDTERRRLQPEHLRRTGQRSTRLSYRI
jgi:hypothetical protein